jgi:hypothetical protein
MAEKITVTKENIRYGLVIVDKNHPEYGLQVVGDYDSRVPYWSLRGDRGVKVLFETDLNQYEFAEGFNK